MSSDLTDISANKDRHIGGYVVQSTIGKGSFASVKLARHILTGTEVAVKVVRKRWFSDIFQEANCLMSLSHPNIATLFEMIVTQDKTFLFMEPVRGGHLLDHLERNGPSTEDEARATFRQIISAVQYCHQKGVTHRDLKPENILLDGKGNIKLIDFGFSTTFSTQKLDTFCGTIAYMAPEILQCEPYDGPKVDTWSLGVILYRMLAGNLPFLGETFEEQRQQIVSGQFLVPDFLSSQCQELLKRILTVDPNQRITLEEIIKDEWVNLGQEELRPYNEPPRGYVDPHVTEMMEHLGFQREEIEKSVSERVYDKTMGTYMILCYTESKRKVRTIKVRPCPSSDSSSCLSASQGIQALGPTSNTFASPPPSLGTKMIVPSSSEEMTMAPAAGNREIETSSSSTSTPPNYLGARMIMPSPSLEMSTVVEAGLTIPESCLWSRMAVLQSSLYSTVSIPPASLVSSVITPIPGPKATTPSPALQHGSVGSTTAQSHSTCLQPALPEDGTPGFPSSSSHGRQGLARRILKLFLKCICCQPCTSNKHHRKTRVKPV